MTTQPALTGRPRSYVGVERGEAEAARARAAMTGPDQRCIVAPVHRTGLPDARASVVIGEALLTLEHRSRKLETLAEVARLLRPGGGTGCELLLSPDGLAEAAKDEIQDVLTTVLRIGARPLTASEWRELLEQNGFDVRTEHTGPLLLLDPRAFVKDEGVAGTLGFAARCARHPQVVPRLARIVQTFRRYRDNLGAIVLTANRR